ncbi:MAG TPA: M56 family metallopeptidase [Bryobacteraceae bacterium]|nr:M56 family metallopeptidase [Bryobacteraceae bacterium]
MNFVLDFGVKSALALGLAFLFGLALRRASASILYALWTCALAAVLILPLVSWIGPRWNIEPSVARRATLGEQQARPSVAVVVQAKRPVASPDWLKIVWLSGMAAMLLRILAGHWRTRSLFRGAEPLEDPLAERIAARIGSRGRSIVLKRTTATDVPLSYGLFRSTVLLPGGADHWTQERRGVVLAHEMIHARRLDSLWGLLAQASLAVNWFNPLAWLAAREFRREQERSCDDAVVMAGTDSTAYAAHLVELARSIAIPEPALGMAERFDLEGRVHALLDARRARREVSRTLCAEMLVMALALMVPLAVIHAQPGAGSIAGTVYDPSGAVVPHATVRIKSTSGPNEGFAQASAAGQYKLQNIAPGEYLLKAISPGFALYQKTIKVEAGSGATLDVSLTLGDVTESVEIVGKKPQQAAPINRTPQRIRVGGNVQAVKLISKVNPAYPEDAQAEGVEGTVLLKAVISKDGGLLSVTSVSNGVDPRLVRAAMAAVPLWRYQPTLLNGEPVEVITTIAVIFRLN